MARSIDYKITPMSVSAVVGFYRLGSVNAVAGYKEYLDQNIESHHYNDLTLEEWFITEVQTYVNELVAKGDRLKEKVTLEDYSQCAAWAN